MTFFQDPWKRGTLYCACAPLAYASYNLCLREVSVKYDSGWITCVQASVSMAVFGVYLTWQAARGRRVLAPWKEMAALAVIGVIAQLGGGVLMVWAMGVVGVAATATLQMGVMLAASALMGAVLLGERVSKWQVGAIAMIVVAVIFFSRGTQAATAADGELVPNAMDPIRGLLGVAAAVLSGLAFAVLLVGVRKTVTGATSPEMIVFLINAMGVVAIGPWCLYRLGFESLAQTPPRDLGVMLAAGAMNLIGFLLVTKSLQLIPVIRVNVINSALTMAISAVAGIVLFAELWNRYLLLGIGFSICGAILINLAGPCGSNRNRVIPPEGEVAQII